MFDYFVCFLLLLLLLFLQHSAEEYAHGYVEVGRNPVPFRNPICFFLLEILFVLSDFSTVLFKIK